MTNKQLLISIALSSLILSACNKQNYSYEEQSISFGQSVILNNQVDILILVDNSPSMRPYQEKLSKEVGTFLKTLNSVEMDYRIAVITTDMRTGGNGGRFLGTQKVLSKATANLEAELSKRIIVGESGSSLERGLESIETVLSPSYLNSEGAGFLRSEAVLAIIALSNEDDYSNKSVEHYKSVIDTAKPKFANGSNSWLLNFIGITSLKSPCQTSLNSTYIDPGERWMELASATNGVSEEICTSSLGAAVSNINKRIVEVITDYALSTKPNVETIRVFRNSEAVPRSTVDGWDYVEAKNVIRFYGSYVPKSSDKMSVDFTPATSK